MYSIFYKLLQIEFTFVQKHCLRINRGFKSTITMRERDPIRLANNTNELSQFFDNRSKIMFPSSPPTSSCKWWPTWQFKEICIYKTNMSFLRKKRIVLILAMYVYYDIVSRLFNTNGSSTNSELEYLQNSFTPS